MSRSIYLSLNKNLSDLSDRSHQEENAGSCTLSTKCTAALCKEVHSDGDADHEEQEEENGDEEEEEDVKHRW